MTTSPSNRLTAAEMFALVEAHSAGGDQPVSAARLSDLIHDRDTSAHGNGGHACVRRYVRAAIRAGYPICSSDRGYWVPKTGIEMQESAARIRQRAFALLTRADWMDNIAATFGRNMAVQPPTHAAGV